MVLVEVFAYLTEMLIYRLNRLPEKVFIEFLNLMGIRMRPPAAAEVNLIFSRTAPGRTSIEIPVNTPVTMNRTTGMEDPPILFHTVERKRLDDKSEEVKVLAIHGKQHVESIGVGTGKAGLSLKVSHAPIIESLQTDPWNVELGIEADYQKDAPSTEIEDFGLHNGKHYRRWREVNDFTHTDPEDRVFMIDRASGHIFFAPAFDDYKAVTENREKTNNLHHALAAVPPLGRDIVVRYYSGGGSAGNRVPRESLNVIKKPIPGVKVTNLSVPSGGHDMESFENVLKRGPYEMRRLDRAITAIDYEQVVESQSGMVNRARAFTQVDLWQHAVPGNVEVFIVPAIPKDHIINDSITNEEMKYYQGDGRQLNRLHELLDQRRAIGTGCIVKWAACKSVRVKARVVINKYRNPHKIKEQVVTRLNRSINPLRLLPDIPGWRFGNSLHVSHIYDICLSEPGVSYLDKAVLAVDHAPDDIVPKIEADSFQSGTWFAACRNNLFRSQNDGFGWELVGVFPLENESIEKDLKVKLIASSNYKAGLLAIGVEGKERNQYRIYLSFDCGTTWRNVWNPELEVHDMVWIKREESSHILLLATDQGLYEIKGLEEPKGHRIPLNEKLGTGSISVLAVDAIAVNDMTTVAVALGKTGSEGGGGGVYLSRNEGKGDSFREVNKSKDKDIRSLSFQQIGWRTWLYGGMYAVATDKGDGSLRWELTIKEEGLVREAESLGENSGWKFGNCYDLCCMENRVFAGTRIGGMVSLDTSKETLRWEEMEGSQKIVNKEKVAPVKSVACTPGKRNNMPGRGHVLMAAMDKGIYHSLDMGINYSECSQIEFEEQVTIPETWLFCSGNHEVEVIDEDQADPGKRGKIHELTDTHVEREKP